MVSHSIKHRSINFDMPTSWRHGRGMASRAGKMISLTGCKKPLLLTDNFLLSSGVTAPVIKSLERENITYMLCDEVNMEPTVGLFESIANKLDLSSFDSIIAVGGGSVLDVSKGLSILGSFGGSIRDYDGFDLVPEIPRIKVVAIPTTSGTGSEVSDGVVLIDESRNTKFLIISKKICPAIALTDPEMTKSMPPLVTACSGMDALVHSVESYISKGANPITELFALKAMGLISKGIRAAYHRGDDMDAREDMQIGATTAMIAAMNSYLGLCHAMAMPLCALYNIPHGQVCGMLLPHVLKFNSPKVGNKVNDIFHKMGFKDGYHDLNLLLRDTGLFTRLQNHGYKDSDMETIINGTLGSAQAPTNPRKPTRDDIANIVGKII